MRRIINPGTIDRRYRGLQRPWGSEGRHALLWNEPEQLRGRLSPYHARPGHQGGRDDEDSGLCRYWDLQGAVGPRLSTGGAVLHSHNEAGVAQAFERLNAVHPTLVVLEATGGMEVCREHIICPVFVARDLSGLGWSF